MKPQSELGSKRTKRSYTKAEKLSILKLLEKNNFNMTLTAQKTGVNVNNIKRWKKELYDEIKDVKPSNSIAVQVANKAAAIELVELTNEARRQKIAGKALDIVLQRLQDKPNDFTLADLLMLSRIEVSANNEIGNTTSTIINLWKNLADKQKLIQDKNEGHVIELA